MPITFSETDNSIGLNPSSTLGGLLTLGANFIPGAGFLTPLGLGLGAIGAAQQGDTAGMNGAIDAIKAGGWKKPKKDKTTQTAQSTVTPTVTQPTDAELAKKWGAGSAMAYNWEW